MPTPKAGLRLEATPAELRDRFFSLETPQDVAKPLDVPYKTLRYYVTRIPEQKRYDRFTIPKRAGGTRVISSPATPLKIIQRKLNQVLQAVYRPKPSAQGFLPGRSIRTNAELHVERRYVLNIDLQDFFPSINFGRVRGMFMALPYKRPEKVATLLAQICCHENELPQGAPTSPIVSNMLCAKLDTELQRFAARHKCRYSRYADDLTFSTNQPHFPKALALLRAEEAEDGGWGSKQSSQLIVGRDLARVLERNGFTINPTKARLRHRSRRQEVTGLTVNEFPNVTARYLRQLRAMLHAWEKFGLRAAHEAYHQRYWRPVREGQLPPSFEQVVMGRLNYLIMVRGPGDPAVGRLLRRYRALYPLFAVPFDAHDALWVIDSLPDNQGTGFMLQGYGLVTCAHVLGAKPVAFRAATPYEKYPVEVLLQDLTFDVALLKVDAPALHALPMGDVRAVSRGQPIRLLGFPNYAEGQDVYDVPGTVGGTRLHHGVRCMMITPTIIRGNSGGPVLNSAGQVIGIARTGSDVLGESVYENAVLPITLVPKLLGEQEKLLAQAEGKSSD